MTARTWSQRELEELVRGKVLSLYVNGTFVEIPAALLEAGGQPGRYRDTMEITHRIHPDDRDVMLNMGLAAMEQPGEVVTGTYRFLLGEDWMRGHSEMVFLPDEPVGGVLTATTFEPLTDDGEGEVGPRPERAGEDGPVHWMVLTVSNRAVVLSAEGAVEQMLGRAPAEIVGLRYKDLVHPDAHSELYTAWMATRTRPESTRVARRCFVRPDGTEQWAECAYVRRVRPDGEDDLLAFAIDITERMAQEEQLRRVQEELRLLAEQVPAAVFRADEDGSITFTNHRWRDLLGDVAAVARLPELARPADRARVEAALRGPGPASRRVEVTTECGRRRLAINLREVRDPLGGRTTFVGSVDDETALRHQADHDDLTGLLSRRAFEERVAHALAANPGRGAVGFIDLDRFKAVNDIHGHDVGDAALVAIAGRLRQCLRETDYVGRYGGDEFVVFCPDTEDPELVAARISRVCDEPVALRCGSWAPGASIGVALAEPGETVSDLLRRADQAMFTIKRAQRVESGTLASRR